MKLILFIICFLCLSCVSTYNALQKVEPGLSKQEVRQIVGKPFLVKRQGYLDNWTYKLSSGSQEYTRSIFFEDGKVFKLGPFAPYPNYEKKMIQAESLEDYEISAGLHQKQKNKGFRKINSIPKKEDTLSVFCSKRFKNPNLLSSCKSLLKGQKVFYPALKLCEKNKEDQSKLQCLKTILNKKFSTIALNFCEKKIPSEQKSLECLNIISNKKFSKTSLNFCNKKPISEGILKCLKNLGHSSI